MKSKWEIIGGQYSLSVDAKKMDSNPTGAGIFITSADDYMLSVGTDLSQSTISGIMSLKSGSTLNVKSATAMTIHTETALTSSAGTVYTIKSGDGVPAGGSYAPTGTNKVDINPT